MDADVFDGILDSSLLQGLDPGELAMLAGSMQRKTMPEGTTVFIQNMPGEILYLVQRGAVQMSRMSPDGEEQTLIILGAEEIFGEISIVVPSPRLVTARIVEDACLLTLSRKDFDILCDRHPRLGMKIMRNLLRVFSERQRGAEEDYDAMLRFALRQS
jgi:CRP/FNR family transcriptional regulator, cyclic AMP receptor protein